MTRNGFRLPRRIGEVADSEEDAAKNSSLQVLADSPDTAAAKLRTFGNLGVPRRISPFAICRS